MLAVLDPLLLVPFAGCGKHNPDDSVDSLLHFHGIVRASVLTVITSEELLEDLAANQLLPIRDLFDAYLQSSQDHTRSGHDLARVSLDLQERALKIEDFIDLVEIRSKSDSTHNGSTCTCHPLVSSRLAAIVASVSAVAALEIGPRAQLIASPTGHCGSVRQPLSCDVLVGEEGDLIEEVLCDLSVSRFGNLRSYLVSADSRDIAQVGLKENSPWDLLLAIYAEAAQMSESNSSIIQRSWGVQESFLEDVGLLLRSGGERNLGKILRSCAEVICGQALADGHSLRVGSGATSKQIFVDGAAAWRQDVDHELHIHYWSKSEGGITFASVRGHSYMQIPERDRDPLSVSNLID